MVEPAAHLARRVAEITSSGASIYDAPDSGSPTWFAVTELEHLLQAKLIGLSLSGLPLRTRSKVVKNHVCRALGYPVPSSFRKSQPRFPSQDFDTYVQKSNNLQIWNEGVSPSRRYVLVRVNDDDVVTRVRVVTGDTIAKLDTTGTLTRKYQARYTDGCISTELVTPDDTDRLRPVCCYSRSVRLETPMAMPTPEHLMPIAELFARLRGLIGTRFPDAGSDQERNRGAQLHALVSHTLGYSFFGDNGQFPDLLEQLLEVKLQTSPTIDLGLVTPDSEDLIDAPPIGSVSARHCDVRYAIFRAKLEYRDVLLSGLALCTGASFFGRFPKFQGRVVNRKLQIPLPSTFFDS